MKLIKPYDKSYTEMAIEFDREFYTPERDDTKLFSYMYFLFYMLASKRKFFQRFEDIEGYAYFASSIVYTRMVRMDRKGIKYKSVLNYVKACLSGTKVQYQNATFDTVFDPSEERGGFDSTSFYQKMSYDVQSQYNIGMEEELTDVLRNSIDIIWDIVSKSPYGKDKYMCHCLRMSILLTFLNQLKIPNQVMPKIDRLLPLGYAKYTRAVASALLTEAKKSAILWRLDDKYKDYVMILLKRVKEQTSEKFKDTQKSFELSDATIADIMSTAYATYDSREDDGGK